MIDDKMIEELLVPYKQCFFNREDIGYGIAYKSNPTIVSTDEEAFRLNPPSELKKVPGYCYIDRVLISKNATRAEVEIYISEMLNAYMQNESMRRLDIVHVSFKRPGYELRYLAEIENDPSVFELRLYAKGYRYGE